MNIMRCKLCHNESSKPVNLDLNDLPHDELKKINGQWWEEDLYDILSVFCDYHHDEIVDKFLWTDSLDREFHLVSQQDITEYVAWFLTSAVGAIERYGFAHKCEARLGINRGSRVCHYWAKNKINDHYVCGYHMKKPSEYYVDGETSKPELDELIIAYLSCK